jgi:hypothetical protein
MDESIYYTTVTAPGNYPANLSPVYRLITVRDKASQGGVICKFE